MYDVRCTTSEEEEEEEEEDLDCPVPEHVGLCQEGVAGDIGEGVALAHLLWGDERRKQMFLRHHVMAPMYNSPSVAAKKS